jgi:hypothetical protein
LPLLVLAVILTLSLSKGKDPDTTTLPKPLGPFIHEAFAFAVTRSK